MGARPGSRAVKQRPRSLEVGLLLLLTIVVPNAVDAADCKALASVALSKASVTLAESVAPGAFRPPSSGRGRDGGAPPAPFAELPEFCRVVVIAKPAAGSAITIEIWLPATGWNGKFEAVGGQGWAGSIGYAQLRAALRRGYAVSATDSGHAGGDPSFALNPDQFADFATRSTHEMAVTGKAVVNAFYGASPRYSYFDGCSTGGRMALTEAQRFPEDFDGIVAGAPANFSSHQAAQMMSVGLTVHKNEASFILPAKLTVLHQAVLNACDARDGVKDGVLENPRACTFNPEVLACRGADGPDCLTSAQVASAQRIYQPVVNPRTKQSIFPGLARGSELGWSLLAGAQPLAFPREMYQYVFFQDPQWDYRTLNLDTDVARAEKAHGGAMDAIDPDLSAFIKRGGRLLQYHGWSDQAVAPENSIDYYDAVVKRLGGSPRVQNAYRLFMVPGMGHCGGGAGPNSFDMLTALERWVEQGEAPARILASRVEEGAVKRSRPLCPFPQTARYTGSGSTDDAANFVCRQP